MSSKLLLSWGKNVKIIWSLSHLILLTIVGGVISKKILKIMVILVVILYFLLNITSARNIVCFVSIITFLLFVFVTWLRCYFKIMYTCSVKIWKFTVGFALKKMDTGYFIIRYRYWLGNSWEKFFLLKNLAKLIN